MSIEQARQHWHKGIAVGKLNVVHAEGKEPRLVLDSTVCGVNPKCNIPERISLPMASDVRLAFMPEDTHSSFIGASFDFKAAHKQVQVHPSEHGLLLFRFADNLYHYRVCHFGAGSPHTGGNAQELSCSDCYTASCQHTRIELGCLSMTFWPRCIAQTHTNNWHWLSSSSQPSVRPFPGRKFAWNLEVGAFEKAPQRGADPGKGHALSFPAL